MADYLLQITTTPAVADAKPVTVKRLVRAKNQAQAISHVVKDSITVAVAETEDIIACAESGVKLEIAE